MNIERGQMLSHYRLVEKIGAGCVAGESCHIVQVYELGRKGDLDYIVMITSRASR